MSWTTLGSIAAFILPLALVAVFKLSGFTGYTAVAVIAVVQAASLWTICRCNPFSF